MLRSGPIIYAYFFKKPYTTLIIIKEKKKLQQGTVPLGEIRRVHRGQIVLRFASWQFEFIDFLLFKFIFSF